MSHEYGELIPILNKLTTDKVDTPKAAPAKVVPSTPTTVAPTQPRPPSPRLNIDRRRPEPRVKPTCDLARILLLLRHLPPALQGTHDGRPLLRRLRGDFRDGLNRVDERVPRRAVRRAPRVFELMTALANTALHRYIKNLTRVRMDLSALQAAKQEDASVGQFILCIKVEREMAQSRMRRGMRGCRRADHR